MPVPTRYRTFIQRFFAGMIDGLLFVPLDLFDDTFFTPERSRALLVVAAIVSFSAFWVYSVLMHTYFGQTLGKMAMRVKVLDVSEERLPTLQQAFLRDSPYVVMNVSALGFFIVTIMTARLGAELESIGQHLVGWAAAVWFLLEVISMLTNAKRRAVHDFIAGTVVVKAAQPGNAPDRQQPASPPVAGG
jgi:uncharacterized RDD family membrane protein YckC